MATPKGKPAKSGRSIGEFRSAHDKSFIVPKKIRDGLKQLGDGWAYEGEFLKIAGLSTTDLANFREEFLDDHTVMVDRTKRVWCGTKSFAEKIREMT